MKHSTLRSLSSNEICLIAGGFNEEVPIVGPGGDEGGGMLFEYSIDPENFNLTFTGDLGEDKSYSTTFTLDRENSFDLSSVNFNLSIHDFDINGLFNMSDSEQGYGYDFSILKDFGDFSVMFDADYDEDYENSGRSSTTFSVTVTLDL